MPTAVINIPKRKFTRAYHKIAAIKSRFRVIKGSANASKSYSVAQDEILTALRTKQKTLIIRKVGSTVKDSIFASFKARLLEFGLKGRFRERSSPHDIELPNGSVMLFRGLDDPEKMKSIEGITRIVIEEATELEYDDFKELNRRVRGSKDIQITLMFNPVDENHWIKKHFFDVDRDNATCITLTYMDNEYATEEDVKELLSLREYDENQFNIYAMGEWGQMKSGSEYYPHWSISFVEAVEFLPGLQHMVTGWDFNAVPYMTCICCQIQYITRYMHAASKVVKREPFPGAMAIEVLQFRVYKEYTFESPRASVESIAEQYKSDHEDMLGIMDATMDVYLDAQGFNRVEGLGGERRLDWVLDSQYLAPFIHNNSLKAHNPNVAPIKRRDFINEVFAGRHPEIEIVIDPSCVELIDDFKHCKQGVKQKADGSTTLYKIKKRVKNKATGETYEEHGHASDGFEVIISEVCRDMIKKSKIEPSVLLL